MARLVARRARVRRLQDEPTRRLRRLVRRIRARAAAAARRASGGGRLGARRHARDAGAAKGIAAGDAARQADCSRRRRGRSRPARALGRRRVRRRRLLADPACDDRDAGAADDRVSRSSSHSATCNNAHTREQRTPGEASAASTGTARLLAGARGRTLRTGDSERTRAFSAGERASAGRGTRAKDAESAEAETRRCVTPTWSCNELHRDLQQVATNYARCENAETNLYSHAYARIRR